MSDDISSIPFKSRTHARILPSGLPLFKLTLNNVGGRLRVSDGRVMDSQTRETYYRALPARITTPTENRYIADVQEAFDWVLDIQDATPDYLESAKVTQQKLKQQHNVDTELVKVEDQRLLQPKYVLYRKVRENEQFQCSAFVAPTNDVSASKATGGNTRQGQRLKLRFATALCAAKNSRPSPNLTRTCPARSHEFGGFPSVRTRTGSSTRRMPRPTISSPSPTTSSVWGALPHIRGLLLSLHRPT